MMWCRSDAEVNNGWNKLCLCAVKHVLSNEGTWCVLITNLLFASQNPTNGSQDSAESSLEIDGAAIINHFIYISVTWYLDIALAGPWTG